MVYNDMKIDWLAFTFNYDDVPTDKMFSAFFCFFPELSESLQCSVVINSKYCYQHSLLFNENIIISYDETSENNKGVNVQIPSHYLEEFLSLLGFHNEVKPIELFRLLKNRFCTLSRIDLAYDDFTKRFRPIDYHNYINNGNFRTRFACHSYIGSLRGTGDTFYLGRRGSYRFMRIYDKDLESNSKIDSVRYEFELHAKGARDFMQLVLDNTSFTFGDMLCDFFCIINPDSDSNISRCELLDEWATWLTSILSRQVLSIPKSREVKSPERTIKWVEQYVAPSLKAYCCMLGKSAVFDLIEKTQLSIEYKRLINIYLRK